MLIWYGTYIIFLLIFFIWFVYFIQCIIAFPPAKQTPNTKYICFRRSLYFPYQTQLLAQLFLSVFPSAWGLFGTAGLLIFLWHDYFVQFIIKTSSVNQSPNAKYISFTDFFIHVPNTGAGTIISFRKVFKRSKNDLLNTFLVILMLETFSNTHFFRQNNGKYRRAIFSSVTNRNSNVINGFIMGEAIEILSYICR